MLNFSARCMKSKKMKFFAFDNNYIVDIFIFTLFLFVEESHLRGESAQAVGELSL